MRVKDEKDFYIEALQAKLAEVHQTLAPLVDDDNRPVEALARAAVELVADAQEELRKCQQDAIQLQARLAEAELHLNAERYGHEQCHAELLATENRLAEAEALLREARRKIRDIDGMNASQFVDEGIGLSGFNLLAGIDAFLAPKEKERE